ncbi:hypothetical protein [Butyrivibrio sp. FC2001]|uniref:hypothetical protein n=1 Tax=Butyrivibrio sp. FC2001 TaxID=1280671 RepID=UPI00040A3D2A|nr:hypothetical protein [Butyrivibrio sp. FC2001]
MKKSLKKALIVGSVFAAAMNFNACGYGPPEGMSKANAQKISSQSEDEVIVAEVNTEGEASK